MSKQPLTAVHTDSLGKQTVDLLRFAAALFVRLRAHVTHELATFDRTAARFHFFAAVRAHHLRRECWSGKNCQRR
jgi:hypothetical protein